MPAKKKISNTPAPKGRPSSAHKAKLKPKNSASEEMFQQLFGEGAKVDDILQISFDDVEQGRKKREHCHLSARRVHQDRRPDQQRWYDYPVGMTPVLIRVFVIGSIQLFFIGLLGEYILNVHTRIRQEKRQAFL